MRDNLYQLILEEEKKPVGLAWILTLVSGRRNCNLRYHVRSQGAQTVRTTRGSRLSRIVVGSFKDVIADIKYTLSY